VICLTSPESSKSRQVREKARLGRPMSMKTYEKRVHYESIDFDGNQTYDNGDDNLSRAPGLNENEHAA